MKFEGPTYKDIESAIEDSGSRNLFNAKAIKKAEQMLYPDELIVSALSGSLNEIVGIVVLTTKRVLSCSYSLGTTQQEEILIKDIKKVDFNKPLLGQASIAFTGKHVTIKIEFHKKAADKFYEAVTKVRQYNNILSESSADDSSSIEHKNDIELIKSLNDLYKAGILTEDEFNLKKKQILGI